MCPREPVGDFYNTPDCKYLYDSPKSFVASMLGLLVSSSQYCCIVALIKLSNPVSTDTFPPIKLNDDCDTPFCQGTERTNYGMGADVCQDCGQSPVLKFLNTEYQSSPSTMDVIYVKASDTSGACGGDSGGPLILDGNLQVGVVSFGSTDCASGRNDGFARVSSAFGWIQEKVCDLSSDPGDNFDCSDAAKAIYNAKQGFVKRVDSFSQAVGINFRGELGRVAGYLGFADNDFN
jgi:Trypsin